MGEASNRGDHAERREQSLERSLDEAEVVIFLKVTDGKLKMELLARDETPNQDSPAMILAAYLNGNFEQLAGEAMALRQSFLAAQNGEAPRQGTVMDVQPKRSILTLAGTIARDGEDPALVGPDGKPLQ